MNRPFDIRVLGEPDTVPLRAMLSIFGTASMSSSFRPIMVTSPTSRRREKTPAPVEGECGLGHVAAQGDVLIAPYPGLAAYPDRCLARPAGKRTVAAYHARVVVG